MNCMAYREGECNEYSRKGAREETARMVKVDEMQFGFMPGKGMIDAVFILRRLLRQKEVVYVLC